MPRRYKEKIADLLKFSGSKKSPDRFVNTNFIISIVVGVALAIFFIDNYLIAFIAGFAVVFVILHGFLILAVDRRTKFIEGTHILPLTLSLLQANSNYQPSSHTLPHP